MASEAASQFGLPLQDPASESFERRDRARSVSADLEAIFGEPHPAAAPRRAIPVGRAPRRAPTGTPPRRLSAASIGGLLAAALAGIAAGSLLVKAPHSRSSVQPAPATSHPDRLPVEMAPPVQTPVASDAALAAPAAPAEVAEAPALPHPEQRAKANRRLASGDVRAADRRLRAAYAAAIRSGTPRAVLASYRNRWEGARRREADNPARLAASYDALAANLNQAARHHSRARPVRRSFLRRRLASWWR